MSSPNALWRVVLTNISAKGDGVDHEFLLLIYDYADYTRIGFDSGFL